MSEAYVDTSAILSVEFREPGWEAVAERMRGFSYMVSSNLLEAEVRATFVRDGRAFNSRVLSNIEWVSFDRPLSDEFEIALRIGYLRGADLWHIATAMYMFDEPSEVTFLTLDRRQEEVAAALGFQA
ncbi:MAG: type II toxin-antitoxin system VapC family toxin [Dehalococcoidia bacterium]|nr:type II toxin-antitoxin system VapC family toxin [Dehalococcoidia bacterium]